METTIHKTFKITLGEIRDLGEDHGFVRSIFIKAEDMTYELKMFGNEEGLGIVVKTENTV